MSLKKTISYIIVISIFGFLLWNILINWQEVRTFPWRFSYQTLFALFVFAALIYPANVLSWHLLTRALGIKLSFVSNARIWMYSNLSRFLPGKIWQYPARVYLLSKEGVDKTQATTAVVMEVFFILLAGSLSVVLAVLFGELPLPGEAKIIFSSVAIFSLLFIVYSRAFFKKLLLVLSKVLSKKLTLDTVSIPLRLIPQIVFVFFLQFAIGGVILFVLSSSVTELNLMLLPVFIGVFALSSLLGYVTLVAPSGLGVQEASIAALLSFIMPFALASVIAIVFRLILFLSEALIFASLLILKNKRF